MTGLGRTADCTLGTLQHKDAGGPSMREPPLRVRGVAPTAASPRVGGRRPPQPSPPQRKPGAQGK
eukprot:11500178-Alexandrium_andersonii.AAC.1